ncbi:conserved exported protein of unknown function [Nitrospira sp. KM1]|uniref:Lcl C-terminal domain-containing protein n=1 Tax=Nitrospira sp. KM1 TaxID=1936990 RepID=UPI0013A7A7BC|nr:DUF1566 domain-containing protein [Nitrospira sp. KM1]BCA55127.1 conserved exported protein of unknown function [Nitrospira sp. KM1]
MKNWPSGCRYFNIIEAGMVMLLGVGMGFPAEGAERFSAVPGGGAVKDGQTGLVWEQEPDREHDVWGRSNERCTTKEIGGKKGWRGPSVEELKSLIDVSQHDPALPAGHPFTNIKSEIFWTSTPHPTDDIVAWQVSFFSGEAVTDQKSGTRRMWCVLGEPFK